MENTLSVFFGNDRSYISILKPTSKGIALTHLDSTSLALGFMDIDDDFRSASRELGELLKETAPMASKIHAVFSIENAFVHQFPASSGASKEELEELLKFEIRQQMPEYTLEDFHTEAFPMAPRLDGTEMMLAISIERNFILLAEQIFGELPIPLARTDVSQLAAHSAIVYNYPEHANGTVMVLGVQENYIDVSVVRQGRLAYYNL
ncbi:MAG TPA: hypothetical protein VEC36_09910, partial [Patescibacteria group bacterium]|nr:hypothetical protein [Patescibacteria group bacterium]